MTWWKGICDAAESAVGAAIETTTGNKVQIGLSKRVETYVNDPNFGKPSANVNWTNNSFGLDYKVGGIGGVKGAAKCPDDGYGLETKTQLNDAAGKTVVEAKTDVKVDEDGVQSSGQVDVAGQKVAGVHAGLQPGGLDFGAEVGAFNQTKFFVVNDADSIWSELHRLYETTPAHAVNEQVRSAFGITKHTVHACRETVNKLAEALVGMSVDKMWDMGLEDLPTVLAQVSFNVSEGVGAAIKFGYKESFKVGDKKLTFRTFGISGEFGPGATFFVGYMVKGNYKGVEDAICISVGQMIDVAYCGCTIIIPYRKDWELKVLKALFGAVKAISKYLTE